MKTFSKSFQTRAFVLFFCLPVLSLAGCQGTGTKQEPNKQIDYSGMENKSFSDLFIEIQPNEIKESPFDLFPTVNGVVTAGNADAYNSMVVGDGALGQMTAKPVTIIGLRGIRYTLEVILRDHNYTIAFFEEPFRPQFMPFGTASGRDSNKMRETTLTPVATPDGNMAYKEAYMIIECKLAQTYTVHPEEIYSEDNRKFYEDAFESVGSWHKLVIGDITHVWIRK
ncbi:MAG: flavin reductase family protein [Tannerellaceae bacterium]|jgi:flavin reductase (DIM6/NTAB) family NADH-FMN oxidoreductase RutF|nr:flavin reductase family protein [Tannerellaceae bacterium]